MIPKKVRDIITQWREEFKYHFIGKTFGAYTLNANNEIIHKGQVLEICDFMLDNKGELMLPFESCNLLKIETYSAQKLKSFKNFPRTITATVNTKKAVAFTSPGECKGVTSLEGIPSTIQGTLDLSSFHNLSLSKIDKHIDSVKSIIPPYNYVGPVLSLLKIKNFPQKSIWFSSSWFTYADDKNSARTQKLREIISYHLANGKNIIACQEELFKNGLDEYAKL